MRERTRSHRKHALTRVPRPVNGSANQVCRLRGERERHGRIDNGNARGADGQTAIRSGIKVYGRTRNGSGSAHRARIESRVSRVSGPNGCDKANALRTTRNGGRTRGVIPRKRKERRRGRAFHLALDFGGAMRGVRIMSGVPARSYFS